MRTRTLRWLISGTGVLLLASCRPDQPVATSVSPVPPAQPFVFYDEVGDPSKSTRVLSEGELRDIINWVAARTSHPVWLIRVRPSTITETRYTVIAYLVPDEATSRIRVGQAYDVPPSKATATVGPPWRYAQVSMPNHGFTEQLTRPSAPELPFEWPKVEGPDAEGTLPSSQEEVVRISDFLRHWARNPPIVSLLHLDRDVISDTLKLPILRINDMGKEIGVTFGYMHEPLWGHGVGVLIKRTRSGYKVSDWHFWMS